jgi:hypothetical protein
MNTVPTLTVTALLLATAVQAQAAVPVEREVRSVRVVQVYGTENRRALRPIGAIDFSASGSSSRRLGPWDVETDAFKGADGVIFYDDGSASDRGVERQFFRGGDSRCTTLGNVTVCK